MPKQLDLQGKTFNLLTAIEYLGGRKWKCQCVCGNFTETSGHALSVGDKKSCGCQGRPKQYASEFAKVRYERSERVVRFLGTKGKQTSAMISKGVGIKVSSLQGTLSVLSKKRLIKRSRQQGFNEVLGRNENVFSYQLINSLNDSLRVLLGKRYVEEPEPVIEEVIEEVIVHQDYDDEVIEYDIHNMNGVDQSDIQWMNHYRMKLADRYRMNGIPVPKFATAC